MVIENLKIAEDYFSGILERLQGKNEWILESEDDSSDS